MSGFSAEWLALREPADQRARNSDLLGALTRRFAGRDTLSVVDLGCGAGSNLRALAPALPRRQRWRLVDHDAALLGVPPHLAVTAVAEVHHVPDGGAQVTHLRVLDRLGPRAVHVDGILRRSRRWRRRASARRNEGRSE